MRLPPAYPKEADTVRQTVHFFACKDHRFGPQRFRVGFVTRVDKPGDNRPVNERMPGRTHANRWPGSIPAKIHCSGSTARPVRNPVHWWARARSIRGLGVGGLEWASDSTQRFEIAPDSSRNRQRIGIMTGDTTRPTPPGRGGGILAALNVSRCSPQRLEITPANRSVCGVGGGGLGIVPDGSTQHSNEMMNGTG